MEAINEIMAEEGLSGKFEVTVAMIAPPLLRDDVTLVALRGISRSDQTEKD
jgi:hypothetical protein